MGYEQLWLSNNQLFNLFFCLFLCQVTCLHTQLCSPEQNYALLQLKGSFSLDKSASWYCDRYENTSFPKTESWKKGSDCCSWDGVDCDKETGQVIGLDLSCSWLQGTIHPNSTLFLSFPHLLKLNLAFNDFAMSPISPEFTRFSELTHLNLSECNVSRKVPPEVSFLNKLVSLDLSGNDGLRFEEGGFELLIQNLSKIRDLDLRGVNISSSVVPNSLLNLTSLRTLLLLSCGLHGNFPGGIFQLPHLQRLDIGFNFALTGHLPDFMNLSYPLQYLSVHSTGFSGILPDSVGNLKSLETFMVSRCEFRGSIPTSLWNLSQITVLALADNNFSGTLPSSISNLVNFEILVVSNNSLTGPLPSQVIVPPNLHNLNLGRNLIKGTIPSWVFELPALKYLDLSHNKLIGHTLEFQSTSLWYIDLSYNNLHGTVPNSTFELPNLSHLILSSNRFSQNLIEFQSTSLGYIDLSNNNLHGTIPNSTFELPYLSHLILSSNCFSGTIPESIKFSERLIVLDLRTNNFSGTIHDSFSMRNRLETLSLNGNGFEGPIPESLANCTNLEVLDLGRNKFFDKFPHWLGNLPNLSVLILQSNKLHGSIQTSRTEFHFSMLRVLDLSNNHFTGPLPIKYFKSFKAMMNVDEVNFDLEYMATSGFSTYYNSLTMVIKGSTIEMQKILTIFTAIDLSRNEFVGKIPEIIGGLNSIRGLNLSHNSLTGHIPKTLGNLTKVEWLDLSSNKLTGEIPRQLTNLISLGTLNLSQNHLTGPIPRGKQFDTFSNDSYINNLALCGPPLSNTCGDPEATQPPPSTFGKEEDSEHGSGFCWEVILPGYGFGLVIGLVMGYLMFSFGKPQWLVKMVEGIGNGKGKRLKSNARRHGGRRN